MSLNVDERPPDLPDFERPPVREVAIAGHFEPIGALRQAHIGFFWSKVRTSFPVVEDREPLMPYVESLDNENPQPSFQLEMMSSPMPHRAWFLGEDRSTLLQVQRDRLVHNWRYQGDEYPRFEPLLKDFTNEYGTFSAALSDLGLPQPRLNHAEVTYVNSIAAASLDEFLMVVSPAALASGGIGAGPALGQIGLRFPVESDGVTVGRLYVDCQPNQNTDDGEPGYRMTLTFRAPMPTPDIETLTTLLLRGREAIVHTFAGLTDPKYHDTWRRIQ